MGRERECVSSITKVKKSPMAVFDLAKESKQAIYIYKKEQVAGVMLTVEQYEQLVRQANQGNQANEKVELEALDQKIKAVISMGAITATKNLDEGLVSLGFISKKNEAEDYAYKEIMSEISETGKIEYHLRKVEDRRTIIAEVIGEQTNKVQQFDKLLVKKIHLRVD